jgi:tetratricopeptide (TPR) repeat protein
MLAGMIGIPALGGLILLLGAVIQEPIVVLLGVLVGLGSFALVTVLMWVALFKGLAKLREAQASLARGDLASAREQAQWPLAWVFRADQRTRAFYTLGQCAELAGDFPDAAILFQEAIASTPAFAVAKIRDRLVAHASSHLAFALAAAGRIDEARAALGRAHMALGRLMGPDGALTALFDDSGWGMGAASLNQTVRDMDGRDPRVFAVLAGAVLAYRANDPRAALDLAVREAHTAWSLLPHENALLARVRDASQAALAQGGAMRQQAMAAPVDPHVARWVERALGAG